MIVWSKKLFLDLTSKIAITARIFLRKTEATWIFSAICVDVIGAKNAVNLIEYQETAL